MRARSSVKAKLFRHFTFLGEKVLGMFSRQNKFSRDSPQQLNDQRYMVYTEPARGPPHGRGRGGEGRGDKQTDSSYSVLVSGPLWVGMRRVEEQRGLAGRTPTASFFI